QLQDLAFHVDGDLFGEVAGGHRGGHLGDIADLGGEITGHGVDAVGEVFPGARHAPHVRLTAERAVGPRLARDPRDLGARRAELIHHGVDSVLQLKDLALDVHRDLLGEVAGGHRLGDVGNVAHLSGEITGHGVDAVGEVLPGAGHAAHVGLAAE